MDRGGGECLRLPGTKAGAECQPCTNSGYPSADPSIDTSYTCTSSSAFAVSTAALAVTAGYSTPYTVWLTAPPTQEVSVDISCGEEAVCSPASLTFGTASGCCQSLTVNVGASGSGGANTSSLVSHTVSTSDAAYASVTVSEIVVSITNARLVLSATSAEVMEGRNATYMVALHTAPTADVTVTVLQSTGCTGCLSVRSPELIFTPETWNIPILVTVDTISDELVAGSRSSTLVHSVAR
eukprot:gene28429-35235_t